MKTKTKMRMKIENTSMDMATKYMKRLRAMRPDNTNVKLVLKQADFEALRRHLLQDDGKERAGFLLLGERKTDGALELYGRLCLFPEDSDYFVQHEMMVEPTTEYVLKTFAAFTESGATGYLHVHSHPFSELASFSGTDDRYMPGMRRSLRNFLRATEKQAENFFIRLVWGQDEVGFSGECYESDGDRPIPVEEIKIVGALGIRTVSCFKSALQKTGTPNDISGRFQRQVRFLGEDGQRSIQSTRLAVCGVGGLGSSVVAAARGLGFRYIALIDHDTIEENNLNRFQGADKDDIGKAKVEVIAEAVRRFDPNIEIRPVQARVQDKAAHEAIIDADFIINCLDTDSARMEVQLLAARHLKPVLDLGSGIKLEPGTRTVKEMGGQAVLYYPGGPCLLCQGLDPREIVSEEIKGVQRAAGYIQGTDETPASVVTINSVMAGVGLQMAISYLTGFAESPRYLRYDLLRYQTERYSFVKRPDCPVCGKNGIEGRGEESVEVRGKVRPKRIYRGKSLPKAVRAHKKGLPIRIMDKAANLLQSLRLRERRQNA